MAISPIAIATHGALNSPLSMAAVRGHLTIAGTTQPPIVGGGLGHGRWIHPQVIQDRLNAQIEREDEEILMIITAFMELMTK